MPPRVTVLMSVYNAEKYLHQAIRSILDQTWADFEFLIINDGSTDRTHHILSSYTDSRVRVVDFSVNRGLTGSLNRGLRLARGKLIARQDADDLSHPTRLEKQVAFMDAHSDVQLLGTQQRRIDAEGQFHHGALLRHACSDGALRMELMFGNPFVHSSVMFRRDVVWDEFQGYDESYTRAQDYELWSRIARKYGVRNLPQTLIDRRLHRNSLLAVDDTLNNRFSEIVIENNLCSFLQNEEIPKRWAALINVLRTGQWPTNGNAPRELFSVIESVLERYHELHPELRGNREIGWFLAVQLCKLAYFSFGLDKQLSMRAIRQAFSANRGSVFRLGGTLLRAYLMK